MPLCAGVWTKTDKVTGMAVSFDADGQAMYMKSGLSA
jgi:hypothetical protein